MWNSGGIGTYISNLLPLVIQSQSDIKFNLLCDIDKIKNFDWGNYNNVNLINCSSPIYSIAEQYELFRTIPESTDLFWSPHYNIPLLYKGKLLVTVHDIFHVAMPEYIKGFHKRLYAKWMFNAVKRKANFVICVSEFTAKELVRLIGFEKQKLKIVHNGVNNKWSKVIKRISPCTKPYIIYVGNVKPHKNLVRLIQAFETLIFQIPHNLIIIGKKDGFITDDKLVKLYANKLADRVHFTGFVTEEILYQYIINADALVLPSLYEGFGLPPLEAMACGCPCVVSNIASLPEVCGDAALYCDPYDVKDIASKIEIVISDVVLRQKLIELGRKRVKLYTWEKSAKAFMDVVEKI